MHDSFISTLILLFRCPAELHSGKHASYERNAVAARSCQLSAEAHSLWEFHLVRLGAGNLFLYIKLTKER